MLQESQCEPFYSNEFFTHYSLICMIVKQLSFVSKVYFDGVSFQYLYQSLSYYSVYNSTIYLLPMRLTEDKADLLV